MHWFKVLFIWTYAREVDGAEGRTSTVEMLSLNPVSWTKWNNFISFVESYEVFIWLFILHSIFKKKKKTIF